MVCVNFQRFKSQGHKRRRSFLKAAGGQQQTPIDVAVNIGRQAEQLRAKRNTSRQVIDKMRILEIRRKIDLLKGKTSIRRQRNSNGEGISTQEPGAIDDADLDDIDDENNLRPALSNRESRGASEDDWAFSRPASGRSTAAMKTVSAEAQTIADSELGGISAIASAAQLLNAGVEFSEARRFNEASQLLELARKRVDQDVLSRKIGAQTAQELDDQAMWQLASVYDEWERLALAFECYNSLKTRSTTVDTRKKAEAGWVRSGFKLACKLNQDGRYQASLDTLLIVRETAQSNVSGNKIRDELELYIAMALQSLDRVSEAKKVLIDLRKQSFSREVKAQASFMMDVFSVDTSGERNEELHKVWDENFKLPKGSIASVRMGSSRPLNLNLTPAEREFRTWATTYWEERLKSPAYYTFLVLWVTWPFAIPVIAIMRNNGMIS